MECYPASFSQNSTFLLAESTKRLPILMYSFSMTEKYSALRCSSQDAVLLFPSLHDSQNITQNVFSLSKRDLCLPKLPSASHPKGDIWDSGEGAAATGVQRVRFSRYKAHGFTTAHTPTYTHSHRTAFSASCQHLCVSFVNIPLSS